MCLYGNCNVRSSSATNTVPTATRTRNFIGIDIDPDSAVQRFRDQSMEHYTSSQAIELCDNRLSDLDISLWTSVRIPDKLAARVISLYLKTDHPLLGTFEPDLFVTDLIEHRHTSCSSFLVNTLLYWGCVRVAKALTFLIESADITIANVQRHR